MADYEDKILYAKKEVEKAKNNLLEVYFTQIRDKYKGFTPIQKTKLLTGLESIINPVIGSTRQNLSFDSQKARKIREKARLSQVDLVKELGIKNTNSARAQIGIYESGKINPSNPPRGETSKKYMKWLKEKGYNPYNL